MTLSGNRDGVDRLYGLGLALGITVVAWFCSSGEPSPGLWEDLAIAAGARPAAATCDSLWLAMSALILRRFPTAFGYEILRLMGPVTLGFFAYFTAGLLQMILPEFLRRQLAEVRSRGLIRRFAVLPVAALFCLSEPIWRLGLFFTPATLHVLLAFIGFYGFVRFLRSDMRRYAVISYLSLGLLSAEEPLGIVLIILETAVMTRDAFSIKNSGDLHAATYSTLYAFLQRLLTVLTLLSIGFGVYVACDFFLSNGGVEAAGGDGKQAIIDFLLLYFLKVPALASPGGWIYFVGLGLIPLLIVTFPLRRALDIEKILDYRLALCYIIAGFLSFFQLANFPLFWLWQSNKGPDPVGSSLLLAITMLFAAITVFYALTVLLTEIFYRHIERFAGALFHDAPDDFDKTMDNQLKRRFFKATWIAAISVPYILILLSAMCRPNFTEYGMFRAVGDFVRLCADDCAGSPIAITDGSADAGLELELFRRGQKDFKTLSMMGDRTPHEVSLRRRGEEKDSEDWIALGISAAAALRDWVRMKSDRSTNLTVQIGFELWRHDRLPMPPMGATAGRTDGFDPAVQSNLVDKAHLLGERMLKLAEKGAPNVTSDAQLRRMWNFALWRLSRAARMRSDAADRAKNAEQAQRETEFADRLDDANIAYQDVRRRTEWVPRQIHSRFSPREGLRFSLQQADFVLASTYARQILAKNENDFSANFAMGMYYVTTEQYTRAARHLELAAKANPKEPSTLNNLATVEMHLGRIDQALKHAEQALALAPDTPEIKRTLSRIKHEIEKTVKDSEKGMIPH